MSKTAEIYKGGKGIILRKPDKVVIRGPRSEKIYETKDIHITTLPSGEFMLKFHTESGRSFGASSSGHSSARRSYRTITEIVTSYEIHEEEQK